MRPDRQRIPITILDRCHLMQQEAGKDGRAALMPTRRYSISPRHYLQVSAVVHSGFAELNDQRQLSFLGDWPVADIGMPRKMTTI